MATVNVLYDLCAMPEYIEPLRAEAQTAFFGDGGVWKVETIKKLRLLDSFLKESQRLNSTSCRELTLDETQPYLAKETILAE